MSHTWRIENWAFIGDADFEEDRVTIVELDEEGERVSELTIPGKVLVGFVFNAYIERRLAAKLDGSLQEIFERLTDRGGT